MVQQQVLDKARRQVARIGRLMHAAGLTAASDGNISIRLEDRLLITPSGAHKGLLKSGDILVCDLRGRVIHGAGRPSTELRMHLLAYRLRPEAAAVIHAHPPLLTALTVAGLAPDARLLPEIVVLLGEIPVVPYARPGSPRALRLLAPRLEKFPAVALERHGALAVGRDAAEALGRLEHLEHLAKVTLAAGLVGQPRPLGPRQLAQLHALARRLGVR